MWVSRRWGKVGSDKVMLKSKIHLDELVEQLWVLDAHCLPKACDSSNWKSCANCFLIVYPHLPV